MNSGGKAPRGPETAMETSANGNTAQKQISLQKGQLSVTETFVGENEG